MRGDRGRHVRVRLDGRMTVPRGGIAIVSPYDRPPRAATVNGRAAPVGAGGAVVVRRLPAAVVLSY